jgi:hypothetical protein
MSKSGDRFPGRVNPYDRSVISTDEQRWSDRVEYLLKQLTGEDLPDTSIATVRTKLPEFGSLSDAPIDPTALQSDGGLEATGIALFKALLLEALVTRNNLSGFRSETNTNFGGVNGRLDAGLNLLTTIDAVLDALRSEVATKLDAIETTLNAIEAAVTPIPNTINWVVSLTDYADLAAGSEVLFGAAANIKTRIINNLTDGILFLHIGTAASAAAHVFFIAPYESKELEPWARGVQIQGRAPDATTGAVICSEAI